MAAYERRVPKGDRQQEADAERTEGLTPTHGAHRRHQPGCEADDGACAPEENAGSSELESARAIAAALARVWVRHSVAEQAIQREPPGQRE